jgi:hypothetical protein
MKTTTEKPSKGNIQPKKISKLGKAMIKGVLKGAIVELSDDAWGLKAI